MALSDKEVLSDASELVTDLVTDLDKLDLSTVKQIDALNDSRKVLSKSIEIIVAILDDKMGVNETHH